MSTTATDPKPPTRPNILARSVPLRSVLAVVAVLALLGGSFYAGMEYQKYRIRTMIEQTMGDTVNDIQDDIDESFPADTDADVAQDDGTEVESEEEGADWEALPPIELVTDDPTAIDLQMGGSAEITLKSVEVSDDTAQIRFRQKNTGSEATETAYFGRFETKDGATSDAALVGCDGLDGEYETVAPGNSVDVCMEATVPGEAGQVVFEIGTPIYVPIG